MAPKRQIVLAHGAGGRLTHDLIRDSLLPTLDNPFLAPLSDAAILPPLPAGRPALTTDAFVVDPPLFPDSDLGSLSVCGTVNDLAVAGARPLWLTSALILEEGCDLDLLGRCTEGAARTAAEAGVTLVAGDTKVVPRGKGDRIYAITAGLGVIPPEREVGDHRIRPNDVVLVSGPIGDHGATIMACRHGLGGPSLRSDCAPLAALVEHLFAAGIDVHSMHDPTRGGVATTCHETAERSGLTIALDETAVPVRGEVAAVCDVLGLDPLYLACEGRLLAWIAADDGAKAVAALRAHPLGAGAAIIGRTAERTADTPPLTLRTALGGERLLDMLSGMDLPRIC